MKRLFVALLVSIFLIYGVSAISTDMRDEYEQGETMIIEIGGNILETISKEDVEFRRGHVAVPFDYDLRKLGNKHFLWVIAKEEENNYTLILKDVLTTVKGKTERIEFQQNFSIGGNLSDYSIKPGFIFTRRNFVVNVFLNEDIEKMINVNFPFDREVLLKPGENEIKFDIEEIEEGGVYEMNIGKYLFFAEIIPEGEVIIVKEVFLEVNPRVIESTVLITEEIIYPFQIINVGDGVVEGIFIEYNSEIFEIDIEEINLESGGAIELNISLVEGVSEKFKGSGIGESIFIRAGDFLIELPIIVRFTEEEEETGTSYLKNFTRIPYCVNDLDGKVCTAGEVCDLETEQSREGPCCLGKCELPNNGKGNYAWVGWLIAAIVLIVFVFVFMRYKKAKSSKGFGKSLEKADKKIGKNLP